jgi:predicted Zn-dependent peptidase
MPAVHRLANGVRVICDPMPGLQTLALSVVVGRGARHETEHQSGWAHLLEHMVFKAAGERSARKIVEVIEAEGGHINAATGHDRTSFQIRALKGGLGLAMAVVSDLVFRPTLGGEDLAKEKRVIAQEIAEAADVPDDLVFELAQAKAFADQPLGRPVLGTVESVAVADAASLGAFRASLYAPDAIVVSAAGAVEEGDVLDLAQRWFGGEPAAAGAGDPPLARFTDGLIPKTRKLEQAHLVFMLPGPSLTDPDYFAFRLFAEMLGGGMSSRLFQEVREQRGLCYAIDAFADDRTDVGTLGIYAGTAAEDAAEAARVSAEQILALTGGVGDGELARAKAQLKGALFMARESAMARAEQNAGQLLVYGRTLTTDEIAASVDAAGPSDIARVGERLLAPGKVAGAVLGPKPALAAAEAFRAALFG